VSGQFDLDRLSIENLNQSDLLEKYGNIERIMEEESETQTLQCPSQSGYNSLPHDCSSFYRCVKVSASADSPSSTHSNNYLRFKYSCPPGLVFDQKLQLCNFPSWSSSCSNNGEVALVPESKFKCVTSGFFSHATSCEFFYHCSERLEAFEFKCPFDLAFDRSTLQCNWKWLVPSCNNGKLEPKNSAESNTGEDDLLREQLFRLTGQQGFSHQPSVYGANGLSETSDLERLAAAASEVQPVHIRQRRSAAEQVTGASLLQSEHKQQQTATIGSHLNGWLNSVRSLFGGTPELAGSAADSYMSEAQKRQDATWFSQFPPLQMSASAPNAAFVPAMVVSDSNANKKPLKSRLSNAFQKAFSKKRPFKAEQPSQFDLNAAASNALLTQPDFFKQGFPVNHLHHVHMEFDQALAPLQMHSQIRPRFKSGLRSEQSALRPSIVPLFPSQPLTPSTRPSVNRKPPGNPSVSSEPKQTVHFYPNAFPDSLSVSNGRKPSQKALSNTVRIPQSAFITNHRHIAASTTPKKPSGPREESGLVSHINSPQTFVYEQLPKATYVNLNPSVQFVPMNSASSKPVADPSTGPNQAKHRSKPNLTIQNQYHIIHSEAPVSSAPFSPASIKPLTRPHSTSVKPKKAKKSQSNVRPIAVNPVLNPTYSTDPISLTSNPSIPSKKYQPSSAFIAHSSPVHNSNLLIIPVPDNHPKAQSLEEIQKLIQFYPELFPVDLDFNSNLTEPINRPNTPNTEFYVLSVDPVTNTRKVNRTPIKLEEYLQYDHRPVSYGAPSEAPNATRTGTSKKVHKNRKRPTPSNTTISAPKLPANRAPYSAYNHMVIPINKPIASKPTSKPTTSGRTTKAPLVVKLELPHSQPGVVDKVFEKVKHEVFSTSTSISPDRPVFIAITSPTSSNLPTDQESVTQPTYATETDSNPNDESKVFLLGEHEIPKQVFDTLKQVISEHSPDVERTNTLVSETTTINPTTFTTTVISPTTEQVSVSFSTGSTQPPIVLSTVYGTRKRSQTRKNSNRRPINEFVHSLLNSTTSIPSRASTQTPSFASTARTIDNPRHSGRPLLKNTAIRATAPTISITTFTTTSPSITREPTYSFESLDQPKTNDFESSFESPIDLNNHNHQPKDEKNADWSNLWNQQWPPNRSYLPLLDTNQSRTSSEQSNGDNFRAPEPAYEISERVPKVTSSFTPSYESGPRSQLSESISSELLEKSTTNVFAVHHNRPSTDSSESSETYGWPTVSTSTEPTTVSNAVKVNEPITTAAPFSTTSGRRQRPSWSPNRSRSTSSTRAGVTRRPFASRTTSGRGNFAVQNRTTTATLSSTTTTTTTTTTTSAPTTTVPRIYNQQNVNVYIVPGASGNVHLRTTSEPVPSFDVGIDSGLSSSAPFAVTVPSVFSTYNHQNASTINRSTDRETFQQLVNRLPESLRNAYAQKVRFVSSNGANDSIVPDSACAREGLFQHPLDCNRFYQCRYSAFLQKFTIEPFECPIKIAFDRRIIGCSFVNDPTVCIQY
jgi:hypothetical protein